MARLVLGDDHTVFVDALTTVLPQRGIEVVGTADTIEGTVEMVRGNRPDVCLLDRFFVDGDVLDSLDEVMRAGGPRMRLVLLTADRETAAIRRAMRTGAAGYVNKMCGLTALVEAVRKVSAGEPVTRLPALAMERNADGVAFGDEALLEELTPRERECLRLLVNGAHTKTMARDLGVSDATVRTHVQGLLTKMGVHSRLEAVSLAVRHSLVDGT
ncbi:MULTISPECIES: LuxR C-terminal-related transcriptional regulator [Actinopolyspora]|uniref:Two component transcriptional regulator, LuxR family n=1 Tax=Actinopolyspora saharensis TaxID=995062 RepID=A0A1H1AA45_9ACTN|nr:MULTISPECIES: response regulator transcription factor [Actinopolyspora]NHD16906.1 response regulator transcription factor [Actinopolyspora sp. BKK2]NHE76058.1 response regulator transcription factor [Actinopolyspora sp. BKK1]SDQ36450.1 two component transcriptional regulator, LuxR family [Actinopolyspora saharensis]